MDRSYIWVFHFLFYFLIFHLFFFSFKQNGKEAYLADNVFHPLTYEGEANLDEEKDPLQRIATISQINSYGQVPKQLFTKPHIVRDSPETAKEKRKLVIPLNINSLKKSFLFKFSSKIGSILNLNNTPVPIQKNQLIILPQATKYLSWGDWDQTIKVCSLETRTVLDTLEITQLFDDFKCADMAYNSTKIVFAGSFGVLKVFSKRPDSFDFKFESFLYGHTDQICCVNLSPSFSLIVSGSLGFISFFIFFFKFFLK